MDIYIDEIWETYSNFDLNINIGDRGTWTGRVNDNGEFKFTDPADGTIAIIYSKPTTVNAIEGSGSLAYTPYDASVNIEAYNEDLMIQAQMAAAISRHAIYTTITDDIIQYTHDASRFFQIEPYNEYVKFFHDDEISFESQTYAFAYDDVGDHSSTIQCTFPTNVKVIIGGYSDENILSTSEIIKSEELITLYPNPTNGNNIKLFGINDDVTITMYSLEGKLISTKEVSNSKTIQIETSNLANGLYLASINGKNNQYSKTFKVLVN